MIDDSVAVLAPSRSIRRPDDPSSQEPPAARTGRPDKRTALRAVPQDRSTRATGSISGQTGKLAFSETPLASLASLALLHALEGAKIASESGGSYLREPVTGPLFPISETRARTSGINRIACCAQMLRACLTTENLLFAGDEQLDCTCWAVPWELGPVNAKSRECKVYPRLAIQ